MTQDPRDENHIFDDVTSLIKTFQPPALDQTKVFPAANFKMGDTFFPQHTPRAKKSFLFSFLTNLDMTSKPFSSTRLCKGSFYYTFYMKASSISLRQVLCCLTSQWWDWKYSLILTRKSIVAQYDTDGSGEIEFPEFCNMMSQKMSQQDDAEMVKLKFWWWCWW